MGRCDTMKGKNIILIISLCIVCIFGVSGCSREKTTVTSDEEMSSTQISTSEETSVKNKMIIVLKDNETGESLESKIIDDEEVILSFNKICSEFENPINEKYSKAFFDSITSDEYTLYFSSSDFAETVLTRDGVVIVECNGFCYELIVGGKEWQSIVDYLESIC